MIHPVCPHCGRVLRSRATYQHNCPEDPANRDAIMGALENPALPGVARGVKQYAAASVLHGAPCATLMIAHFGSWPAVVAYYGLSNGALQCPHCQRTAQTPTHAVGCPANPANRAAIVAVMEDPDRPGCAVSSPTYEARVRGTGAPGVKAIRNAFGNWQAACAHFGLEFVGQRSQSREAAAMAEVADAVDADRELQRELAGRGLEVCRVRALPDGRVACMLR